MVGHIWNSFQDCLVNKSREISWVAKPQEGRNSMVDEEVKGVLEGMKEYNRHG